MTNPQPFRFGAGAFSAASASEWAEAARRAEAFGYDILLIPDHFSDVFAAGPALTAAALATTTLRVGTAVYDNDFRHPVVLAKETATLDVLSDGRVEVGIGAGWYRNEYDQAGIPFDPAGVRVARMEEAVHVIKGLWADGSFTYEGEHYRINGLDGQPKPLQHPHPPIMIGAGGRRLLSFAAREANSVGIIAQATPAGKLDTAGDTESLLAEKVGWVREAAGERFDRLELSMLIWNVAVTDAPRAAAEAMAHKLERDPEYVLTSPYYLLGSVDAIVSRLQSLRERFGISFFKIFPKNVADMAPVVARLAGT